MEIQVVGKNIKVTEGIRNACVDKISKMDKYFNNSQEIHCRVVVRTYRIGAKVEVTIFTPTYDFRAEVYNDDLYAAIDLSVDKLEGQMRKLKTRMDRKKDKVGFGKAVISEAIEEEKIEEELMELVRTKSIYLDPMTLDEAVYHMEALGHSFFMFIDSEDGKVCTLYKRDEGGYGIIQIENEVKS